MTRDIEAMLAREARLTANFDHDEASKIELELQREMIRCNRYDRPVSVIVMRLAALSGAPQSALEQHRRKVNTLIAKQASDALRQTDYHGRLNANEVMVILPETGLDGAQTAAGKIGRSKIVQSIVKKCAKSFEGLFTGVAAMNEDDESVAQLIDRARKDALDADRAAA